MLRVSASAPTFWPMLQEVFQSTSWLTSPVTMSITRLERFPVHFTVVKVAEKMSRSSCATLGVEVAAAAAAPVATWMSFRTRFRLSTTCSGSEAGKYLPPPLMAACHRSSTRDCSAVDRSVVPVFGSGQT